MAVTNSPVSDIVSVDHLPPDFADLPLRWPDPVTLDWDAVALAYDEPLDTLFVDFRGGPEAAINVPLDPPDSEIGYIDARVVIPNRQVVGVEIAGFVSLVVDLHPAWRDLLSLTGEPRRSALRSVLAVASAMPVYSGPPYPPSPS
jgi:hypothetical protein